ncbi:unnamed protein product [Cyprideis torosa]|uniref:Uncharacterized protein n=1 Tax=Cyprideis torosa TaxID=163714 RepID=A0A7R8ZKC6_9CRUS|nr:unnamed protein product [Cyprideis torosa]CAG0879941.1 unnamed protein product [Cyprideis torosa]
MLLMVVWAAFLSHVGGGRSLDVFNGHDVDEVVQAIQGRVARLPCSLVSPAPNDEVQLVLWYRWDSTKPLYSYDVRDDTSIPQMWSDVYRLRGRGTFNPSDKRAGFTIKDVSLEDEGIYRCRVDWKRSPTVNTIVNLTLIVPPDDPKIVDHTGHEVQTVIGPLVEGGPLVMACSTSVGKPTPHLVWRRDGIVIDSTYEGSRTGEVKNVLQIPSLRREDLDAVFNCSAKNNNITLPTSRSVRLDMTFKPLAVSISNKGQALSAGKRYEILCTASGSRPPATITWRSSHHEGRLTNAHDVHLQNGNVVTSRLILVPTADYNGTRLECRAENLRIPGSAISDFWTMEVRYPPRATLSFGKQLPSQHTGIEEDKDVYFECQVEANPPAFHVEWMHNGEKLAHNVASGVILSNQSLVLQKISRASAGNYTCVGTNAEGKGESPPVDLRVKYPPVCAESEFGNNVYGVARMEEANITCHVSAVPPPFAFRWTFNKSSTELDLPSSTYTFLGHTSVLRYSPKTDQDYGSLLCTAENEIGVQEVPCHYHIISIGKPDPPQNCNIIHQANESVQVRCERGHNGGDKQLFVLEVSDERGQHVWANVTNSQPSFRVDGLEPGVTVLLSVYSVNSRGKSIPVPLLASTNATRGEPIAKPGTGSLMKKLALNSLLPLLAGVTVGMTGIVILLGLLVRMRRCSRQRRRRAWAADCDRKETGPLTANMSGGREHSIEDLRNSGKFEPLATHPHGHTLPHASTAARAMGNAAGRGVEFEPDEKVIEITPRRPGMEGTYNREETMPLSQRPPKEGRHVSFSDTRPAVVANTVWMRGPEQYTPLPPAAGYVTLPRQPIHHNPPPTHHPPLNSFAPPLPPSLRPIPGSHGHANTLDRAPKIPPPQGFSDGFPHPPPPPLGSSRSLSEEEHVESTV